jgi:hypothetical protein
LWYDSEDENVLLSLPPIAFLRGFDKSFSSLLWKEGGYWEYCDSVSAWYAMQSKKRAVVVHGHENNFFFKDFSQMPDGSVGGLSKAEFEEMFELAMPLREFKKGNHNPFSVGVRLEGDTAETLLNLNGRYSPDDLGSASVDVLFGDVAILEKYFQTLQNTDYSLSKADGLMGVNINFESSSREACGKMLFVNSGGVGGGSFNTYSRMVGVAPEALEEIYANVFV